jgi:hypothetical protein
VLLTSRLYYNFARQSLCAPVEAHFALQLASNHALHHARAEASTRGRVPAMIEKSLKKTLAKRRSKLNTSQHLFIAVGAPAARMGHLENDLKSKPGLRLAAWVSVMLSGI